MKGKNTSKFQMWVTVLGFLGFLFVPSVAWIFCHDMVGDDTSENRKLAEMPEFGFGKVSAFPKKFESFWNDHLPFRKIINSAWDNANVKLLRDSSSEKVLIGKSDDSFQDSWLFYVAKADNNPMDDSQGIKAYDDQTIKKIGEKIKDETQKYGMNDIDLYYLVAPNKENVYREFLPDEIEIYKEKTRTEELARRLAGEGIKNFYYAYDDMMEAKDLGQLYYKHDTHWNRLGAFIGFKGLMNMIGEKVELGSVVFGQKAKANGDLLPMLGVQGFFEDKVIEDVKFSGKKINKKIMLIGDSYRTALKEYLDKTFSEVVAMHRSEYRKGMIKQEKPDIVVYEFVERYSEMIKEYTVSF